MPGLAIGTSPAFGSAKPIVVHPLLNDLLAYWSLDETTGNRADSSGNGLTLAPVGSSPTTPACRATPPSLPTPAWTSSRSTPVPQP